MGEISVGSKNTLSGAAGACILDLSRTDDLNVRSVLMPKWLLASLAAIVNIVIAVIAYRSGRVLIPAVLVIAAVCFIIAAAGSARGTRGGAG